MKKAFLLSAIWFLCSGCSLIVEMPEIPCDDAGADGGACIEIYLDAEIEEND